MLMRNGAISTFYILRYEEEYAKQWWNREVAVDLVQSRRDYEKGFVTEPRHCVLVIFPAVRM